MLRPIRRALLPMLLALGLTPAAWAEDITVFAAASLQTALDRIATDHEAATGDRVIAVYGGSSTLAKQIAEGAPADLFISASTDWMEDLAAKGLLDPASRRNLLGNELVLIASGAGDSHEGVLDAAAVQAAVQGAGGGGRLAMALVDSVPAGVYGHQSLTKMGLWDALSPSVVQANDVRAALTLVARGEAGAGIVYASDAIAEPGVHVIGRFAPDSHDPITYPAARLAHATHPEAADRLLAALAAAPAQAIFAENGFTAPDTP